MLGRIPPLLPVGLLRVQDEAYLMDWLLNLKRPAPLVQAPAWERMPPAPGMAADQREDPETPQPPGAQNLGPLQVIARQACFPHGRFLTNCCYSDLEKDSISHSCHQL